MGFNLLVFHPAAGSRLVQESQKGQWSLSIHHRLGLGVVAYLLVATVLYLIISHSVEIRSDEGVVSGVRGRVARDVRDRVTAQSCTRSQEVRPLVDVKAEL